MPFIALMFVKPLQPSLLWMPLAIPRSIEAGMGCPVLHTKAACRKTIYPPHNDCTFGFQHTHLKTLISSVTSWWGMTYAALVLCAIVFSNFHCASACEHILRLAVLFWLSISSPVLELLLTEDLSYFDAPHTGALLSTLLLMQSPLQSPFPDCQSLHADLGLHCQMICPSHENKTKQNNKSHANLLNYRSKVVTRKSWTFRQGPNQSRNRY